MAPIPLVLVIATAAGTGRIDHAQASEAGGTFGKTSVGASSSSYVANRKQVNRYALATAGSVAKLSIYLAPSATSGQQVLTGIIYADESGKPGALLGASQRFTFRSTDAAGWYDLAFSVPVKLSARNHWIGVITGTNTGVAGFRFDTIAASRAYNTNTYTSGPTKRFGSVSIDSKQTSLYATYTQIFPPANTGLPAISGTTQQGHTLTASNGSWTNQPTSFTYQWQRCDATGSSCLPISGATSQTYTIAAADVGSTLRVAVTASNVGGSSAPAVSEATATVVPPPTNISAPAISGTTQQGQTLTASNGSWTNEPTSFAYQWQRCDTTGASCSPISLATSQTYTIAAADVGSTLRVAVTASNASGSSPPAISEATAAVVPPPPRNISAPAISGTTQQGHTLTASNGSWTNEPTSFTYQWQRCDATGSSCSPISLATSQTYTIGAADVGSTLRVAVTASNAGGSSAPASSAPSAVVVATFGKTSVGASSDSFVADRKRINRYSLSTAASLTKLSVYLAPSGASGQQVLEGIVYSDSSGTPESLLGVSEQLIFTSTSAAGWYDVSFPSPPRLAAGTYWIGIISGASSNVAGFRYDSVTQSRDYNANTYTEGPTNPFGSPTVDGEQMSLYASYVIAPEDPILAAAGDISCPSEDMESACQQRATATLTAAQHPTAVAVLGDNQYDSGLLSEFNSPGAYNDTWGQFNSMVYPAPGNHEYAASSSAAGYFSYFGSRASGGYYSYELGSWHIVSLNSACSDSGCQNATGGATSSSEVSWLQGDLAAHPKQCILAYWHHPRFSSGGVGNSPGVAPFWNTLYAAHADLVLNGHDHMYERFAQQDPAQHPTGEGIREFVVGTGGHSLFRTRVIQPNMQVIDVERFGVMFLTLHPGSYDWVFRATTGTVLDSGSTACHS